MFNIRVYGILINPLQQVLISDEIIRGEQYTKFCGGGLEFGEGTIECLKREFMEEMDLPVEVTEHFYTTDFFQQSAFNEKDQIISVYYKVKPLKELILSDKKTNPDIKENQSSITASQSESFRWIEWKDFSADCLSLPIDKVVARLLKEKIYQP